MGLEQLKLSKSLNNAMQQLGLIQAKEVQLKSISRIIGGQSFVMVAPSGSGKTFSYMLGVLMRLKYSNDEAPKVLILVKDQERGQDVIHNFKVLAGNRGLRVVGLFGTGGMDDEISELMEGVDLVVATAARARAIYLKLALNVNKLQTIIVDDADEQMQAGQQLPIHELLRSTPKAQKLVFTNAYSKKLANQLEQVWENPIVLEVLESDASKQDVLDFQAFYVPNFQSKLNFLRYTITNDQSASKYVVFVNSKLTARNLFKEINNADAVVFQPIDPTQPGVEQILDFIEHPSSKVLIVAHESNPEIDLSFMPSMIHLEMVTDVRGIMHLLQRDARSRIVHFYVSDVEMTLLKQMEQAVGEVIPLLDLPEVLTATKSKKKNKNIEEVEDAAFHKKKQANAKDFNYGIGDKIKMNKKRKYG